MKPGVITWEETMDAAANARALLPQLAEEYLTQGNAIAVAGAAPQNLHQLRLATKHFRYTLEAFRPVYGKTLDNWLNGLRQVQQFLGEINDCQVALERFQEDPDAAHFLNFARTRLETRREGFLEYWRVHFGTPDSLRRWQRYLGPKHLAPSKRSAVRGQQTAAVS